MGLRTSIDTRWSHTVITTGVMTLIDVAAFCTLLYVRASEEFGMPVFGAGPGLLLTLLGQGSMVIISLLRLAIPLVIQCIMGGALVAAGRKHIGYGMWLAVLIAGLLFSSVIFIFN